MISYRMALVDLSQIETIVKRYHNKKYNINKFPKRITKINKD